MTDYQQLRRFQKINWKLSRKIEKLERYISLLKNRNEKLLFDNNHLNSLKELGIDGIERELFSSVWSNKTLSK